MKVINYIVTFEMENSKHKQSISFWNARMDSEKNRSCVDPLFSTKLNIKKRRELNLETHLTFLDYVKAFDNVKREKLFEILKSKNISNFLLKV